LVGLGVKKWLSAAYPMHAQMDFILGTALAKLLLDVWCILGDEPISNQCVTRMRVLFP